MIQSKTLLFFGSVLVIILALQSYSALYRNRVSLERCALKETSKSSSVPDDNGQDEASPILFVHFQKSAGSSVCKIMKNQVNMTDIMGNPRTSPNCNVEMGGPGDNMRQYYHSLQTCRLLQLYTENEGGTPFKRFNFVAVEVPFHDSMPCPGFRSFALMRDPVARFESLMRYAPVKYSEEAVLAWIENREPNSPFEYMVGYPVVNSMVIRQLLGRERFVNTTPVNEDDLERAKRQVDAFHAFVPLEYLNHEGVLQVLNRSIPQYAEGLLLNRRAPVNKNQNPDMVIDANLMKRIAEENIHDTMLYRYVLEKFGIP